MRPALGVSENGVRPKQFAFQDWSVCIKVSLDSTVILHCTGICVNGF